MLLCNYQLFLIAFPQLCTESIWRGRKELEGYFDSSLNNRPLTNNDVPDTAQNPFLYLERHNYTYENHTVITEDGYVLLIVRIPYGKKRTYGKSPPVIFVHGIFCTFFDFLNAGPESAIGFQILEAGYDIWLMNSRGNTYSKRHVTLDPIQNASAYWNFSWHELGFYDIPATMDHITKTTGFLNMSIVGHSQGGTAYLAFAATRPEYVRRVTFSIQLAPVAYLKKAKMLVVNTLRDNVSLFDAITKKYNIYELLPWTDFFMNIGNEFCRPTSQFVDVCVNLIEFIAGLSTQTSKALLTVLLASHPAGGSVKEVQHYIQIAISDKFQLYDYGQEGNKIHYNQETPPFYNLSAITSPVAIYYGKSDAFISLSDGAKLVTQLPNAFQFVLGFGTNHIDVQWGTKALENIFRPAIRLLNKFNNRL